MNPILTLTTDDETLSLIEDGGIHHVKMQHGGRELTIRGDLDALISLATGEPCNENEPSIDDTYRTLLAEFGHIQTAFRSLIKN